MIYFIAASATVSTDVSLGGTRRYRPFFVSSRTFADDAAFEAVKADFVTAMAAVFDHPAEDIEATRKTATVVTLTFSIRDPAHTAVLTAKVASDTLVNDLNTHLATVDSLSDLTIAELSEAVHAPIEDDEEETTEEGDDDDAEIVEDGDDDEDEEDEGEDEEGDDEGGDDEGDDEDDDEDDDDDEGGDDDGEDDEGGDDAEGDDEDGDDEGGDDEGDDEGEDDEDGDDEDGDDEDGDDEGEDDEGDDDEGIEHIP